MTFPDQPSAESQDLSSDSAMQGPIRPGTWFLFILLAACLLVVGVAWLAFPPKHRAEAIIECVSNAPKPRYSLELQRIPRDEHERFVLSQSLFVKQPDLLARVLESPEVKGTQWYKLVPKDEQLTELEDELSCSPVPDSNYIRIAMGTRSPKDPHVIVNKVAEVYLQTARDRAVGPFRNELTRYEKEQADTQKNIEAQILRIRAFVGNMPVGVLGQENRPGLTVVEQELLSAQQTFIELQLQTQELEGIQRIYDDPKGPGVTPEDRQQVEQDPEILRVKDRQLTVELEYQGRRPETPENKGDLDRLRAQLAFLEGRLAQMREQRLRESLDLKQEQVRTAYLNSQHAMTLAQERFIEVQTKQADIERKLAEYRRLNDELEFLKTAEEKAADYIRDVKRIVMEQSAIQIELVQSARPPEKTDRAMHAKLSVGAAACVVLYAVVLAIVRALRGRRAVRASAG